MNQRSRLLTAATWPHLDGPGETQPRNVRRINLAEQRVPRLLRRVAVAEPILAFALRGIAQCHVINLARLLRLCEDEARGERER